MTDNSFPIGELSRRTGCKIETIRYYERSGLIPHPRRRGRYRRYTSEDVDRIRFIRRARALGFALAEIEALLGLDGARADSCAEAREIAQLNLATVRTKLADLTRMEATLSQAVIACDSDAFRRCPILASLSGQAALSPVVASGKKNTAKF